MPPAKLSTLGAILLACRSCAQTPAAPTSDGRATTGVRAPAQAGSEGLDRRTLPIAEPDYPHSTVLDARDTNPSPRFEVKAPAGALFSANETAGVGMDDATPVTTDYKERDNSFTGEILKVTVDVKPVGVAFRKAEESDQRVAATKKALSD